MSCSKAKGECKDHVPWAMFPETSSVASGCVVNLKPAPQVEAPGQVNKFLFHRKTGIMSQSAFCGMPCGVVACQELSLQLFQSCRAQKH